MIPFCLYTFFRRDEVSLERLISNTSEKENKLDDTPQTILDLRKAGSRNRSSDMEKIMKEMDVGNNNSNNSDSGNENKPNTEEDDLIALIDGEL